MPNRVPKTTVYKGVTFYLFDVQYTKGNAEFSAHLYASRLPGAKWLVKEVELGKKPKRTVFGIYSTKKVRIVKAKK